jgi:hypothetical protein
MSGGWKVVRGKKGTRTVKERVDRASLRFFLFVREDSTIPARDQSGGQSKGESFLEHSITLAYSGPM